MMSFIECASWMNAMMRICALQVGHSRGAHLIDALYARGPAPTELLTIVVLWFFSGRRGYLSALTPSPTGVATVVSCTAS